MPEVAGVIPPSREIGATFMAPVRTEANSYRTRVVSQLVVDEAQGEWHSLKGGLSLDKDRTKTPVESIRFGIFFDPTRNIWLKTVPPETVDTPFYERFEQRLRKSALQQRVALDVAGLPDLKSQVKDVEVEIGGKKVYGFTAPHIGPSLEFMIFRLTGHRSGRVTNPDAVDFLSHVYSIAADQAEKLYLDFGIWMDDPNPGNILLRQDENGTHVVLIDFSNKVQEEENLFTRIPKDKYSPEGYMDKIRSRLARNIRLLHQKFYKYCDNRGIPFIRDPQEIEANIDRSVAVVNARKTYPPAPLLPSHE